MLSVIGGISVEYQRSTSRPCGVAHKVISAAHQGMCDAQAKSSNCSWTCSGKTQRTSSAATRIGD